MEDKTRAGRPSTRRNEDNVQCARDMLNSDRRLSVQMIADHARIDKTTRHTIITEDFQMKNVCAKLVSKVRKKLAS